MCDHPANLVERFAQLTEGLRNKAKFLFGNHQHHADAQVEGAAVIFVRHIAEFFEQIEDGLGRPGGRVDFDAEAARKDARDVVGETAAGDVGSTF